MTRRSVYLGLGGNRGDTEEIFIQTLRLIGAMEDVEDLEVSRLYQTEPLTSVPQRDYLNAVCRFITAQPIHSLFNALQQIEMVLGKVPKPKTHPRVIDIDILFVGDEYYQEDSLRIPHLSWNKRRFVLEPLADLVQELVVPVSLDFMETVNILQLLKERSVTSAVRPVACRSAFKDYQRQRQEWNE